MIGRWWNGGSKPDATRGPLARQLESIRQTADGRPVDWTFEVLPVLWGIGRAIPAQDFDVVINIGLGVYDCDSTIYLEHGAHNGRSGSVDAAGPPNALAPQIEAGAANTLTAPRRVASKLRAVAGDFAINGDVYTAEMKRARRSNNYVCNETHYLMLRQLSARQRLCRAYFIHIPKPPDISGYAPLALLLKTNIEQLIQP